MYKVSNKKDYFKGVIAILVKGRFSFLYILYRAKNHITVALFGNLLKFGIWHELA